MQTPRHTLWKLAWLWALWLGLALPGWAGGAEVVARVALAVGEAYRIGPQNERYLISVGAELREADTIATGQSGIIILAFIDQARLAMRPNTELVIRRYRIDPAGVDTDLDIALVRGVVRQISGSAAQAQPERYRLNTPIAVIGVRGTDFIAKIGMQQDLQTYVHQGAIVLMPTSSGAAAPGSQPGAPAIQPLAMVSASDAAPYARIRADGVIERRHISPADLEAIFGIQIAAAAVSSNQPTPAAKSAHAASPPPAVALASVVPTDAPAAALPEWVSGRPNPNAPAKESSAPIPMPERQLVWGRFSYASDRPWTLSLPYADARLGRHAVVGEPGEFALWRTGPSDKDLEPGLSGRINFALAAADALLFGAQGTEPVTVGAPRLTMDFDRRRFETQLTLQAPGRPEQTLQAGGQLTSEGRFIGVQPGQRVAGGLSFDGREAGYLFNLQAREGLYQGMTLWSAR